LKKHYGISKNEYQFVDGSGGGETRATSPSVVRFLTKMRRSPSFSAFFDSLPILAVDGSLEMVTDFRSDPTLIGATGQVRAKPGTYIVGSDSGLLLKAQALGGYITTKTGRRLAYQLVVNNVEISSLDDVIQVFQDEGTISAVLWRDH
jgi:D-alanyl-D-alanine carboxypeptidase/D-alanyl-D-alanine carboxypeptidase/D-alanyl-D-alanine-endopeptidase (penicillin-binding protein 4)